MNFDFVEDTIDGDPIYRPKIPLTYKHNGSKFPAKALVDTGASVSVIPKWIAEELGLDLSGETQHVGGIGGGMEGITTTVRVVEIEGSNHTERIRSLRVAVPIKEGFVDELILGGKDFFINFKAKFDWKKAKVTLTKRR